MSAGGIMLQSVPACSQRSGLLNNQLTSTDSSSDDTKEALYTQGDPREPGIPGAEGEGVS